MKRRYGVILIIVAILIGGIAVYEAFFLNSNGKEKNPQAPIATESVDEKTFAIEETATPEPTENPDMDQSTKEIKISIRTDIIQFLGANPKEMARELRIFANSCGRSRAEKVKDMGEMLVEYEKGTVTVPCYFQQGSDLMNFDMIYNLKKNKYRFVPW